MQIIVIQICQLKVERNARISISDRSIDQSISPPSSHPVECCRQTWNNGSSWALSFFPRSFLIRCETPPLWLASSLALSSFSATVSLKKWKLSIENVNVDLIHSRAKKSELVLTISIIQVKFLTILLNQVTSLLKNTNNERKKY